MDQEYKLSAKRADTGKWWTFGNIKKNKYDNVQASLRVTPELKALIEANDGKWINFSLFPVDEKREVSQEAQAGLDKLYEHNQAKANAYQPAVSVLDDDSTIPF